jgi:hypothetical protein
VVTEVEAERRRTTENIATKHSDSPVERAGIMVNPEESTAEGAQSRRSWQICDALKRGFWGSGTSSWYYIMIATRIP